MGRDNLGSLPRVTSEPAVLDKYLVQVEGGYADEMSHITHGDLFAERGLMTEVTITSEELLALNATPVEVLPALTDSNHAYIINSITAVKPAGTAYAGINVNEDINISYTNASGAVLASIETTGFLDQATKQARYIRPSTWTTNAPTAALLNENPVAGAKLVAHMTTGEITTGDTDLVLRINYKIIDIS